MSLAESNDKEGTSIRITLCQFVMSGGGQVWREQSSLEGTDKESLLKEVKPGAENALSGCSEDSWSIQSL